MRVVKKGATSQSVYVVIKDSTSTTGANKTGLAFNSSGLLGYYVRNGGSATAITLATLAAANSAYSSGGFKEVDATNMPGLYRLDVPDAAFASGVDSVVIELSGATGMVPVAEEVQLVAADLQDSVRAGLTALPNAAAEAAGGLYTRGSGAGQINQDANGRVDTRWVSGNVTVGTNSDKTGYTLSAAGVQAVWDALSAALTTVGSIGKRLVDNLTGDIYARLGAPAGASVSADIATVATYVDTEVAAILAAVDTEVAAIKAKTDNLPSGIAKNTALAGFTFLMVDSTDHVTPKTLLTVTAQRSLDGGAFAACANAVAELSNGLYKIDLAAADLNANNVVLRFTAAGADATIIAIKTSA